MLAFAVIDISWSRVFSDFKASVGRVHFFIPRLFLSRVVYSIFGTSRSIVMDQSRQPMLPFAVIIDISRRLRKSGISKDLTSDRSITRPFVYFEWIPRIGECRNLTANNHIDALIDPISAIAISRLAFRQRSWKSPFFHPASFFVASVYSILGTSWWINRDVISLWLRYFHNFFNCDKRSQNFMSTEYASNISRIPYLQATL